jgi:hypothetical protein
MWARRVMISQKFSPVAMWCAFCPRTNRDLFRQTVLPDRFLEKTQSGFLVAMGCRKSMVFPSLSTAQ